MMEVAYAYVIENQWFFLDPTYYSVYAKGNGGVSSTKSQSAFSYLAYLKDMSDSGKSNIKIQAKINEYWSEFNCISVRDRNEVLQNNKILVDTTYITNPPYAQPVGWKLVYMPLYQYYLEEYDTILQGVTEHFSAFVTAYMQYYESVNPQKATPEKYPSKHG